MAIKAPSTGHPIKQTIKDHMAIKAPSNGHIVSSVKGKSVKDVTVNGSRDGFPIGPVKRIRMKRTALNGSIVVKGKGKVIPEEKWDPFRRMLNVNKAHPMIQYIVSKHSSHLLSTEIGRPDLHLPVKTRKAIPRRLHKSTKGKLNPSTYKILFDQLMKPLERPRLVILPAHEEEIKPIIFPHNDLWTGVSGIEKNYTITKERKSPSRYQPLKPAKVMENHEMKANGETSKLSVKALYKIENADNRKLATKSTNADSRKVVTKSTNLNAVKRAALHSGNKVPKPFVLEPVKSVKGLQRTIEKGKPLSTTKFNTKPVRLLPVMSVKVLQKRVGNINKSTAQIPGLSDTGILNSNMKLNAKPIMQLLLNTMKGMENSSGNVNGTSILILVKSDKRILYSSMKLGTKQSMQVSNSEKTKRPSIQIPVEIEKGTLTSKAKLNIKPVIQLPLNSVKVSQKSAGKVNRPSIQIPGKIEKGTLISKAKLNIKPVIQLPLNSVKVSQKSAGKENRPSIQIPGKIEKGTLISKVKLNIKPVIQLPLNSVKVSQKSAGKVNRPSIQIPRKIEKGTLISKAKLNIKPVIQLPLNSVKELKTSAGNSGKSDKGILHIDISLNMKTKYAITS